MIALQTPFFFAAFKKEKERKKRDGNNNLQYFPALTHIRNTHAKNL